MLIRIFGTPGSGKTYICSKLSKNIKCIDTDDYITRAYDLSVKNNLKINQKKIGELGKKLITEEIKKYKSIVVTGNYFDIKADYNFFIKIPNNKFKNIYDRVIKREINKYKIIKIPNNLKGEDLMYLLRYKYHLNAVNVPYTSFDFYKEMYDYDFKNAEKNKDIILKQEQIISYINKLFN